MKSIQKNRLKEKVMLLALLFMPTLAMAQSDFGIWYGAGAEKKINKKWSVELEGEFRTRNDSRTADRWDVGASVEYKVFKNLKASAGYDFLYDNNIEKITYHNGYGTDGTALSARERLNNWRPSYWGTRHRFHVDLTGSVDIGRITLSLRERWQYTYRPSKTTTRYDFDNSKWEDTEVKGKGKNVLRSRLQATWDIPHCKIEPYANAELFNSWSLTKTRYTIGADWKITKQNVVGLYYRYQDVRDNDEDNEPDMHIIGVNYKFKF